MENKLILCLLLSFILSISSIEVSLKQGYSLANNNAQVTTNVTNNKTGDTSSAGSISTIVSQNSDGKLDAKATSFSNETKVTKKGTLVTAGSNIPITYEQIGGLKILDKDTLLSSQVVNGRAAVDRFITSQPWTNGEIPVVINSDIPDKKRIYNALAYVQSVTPITFKPVSVTENGEILDSHYLRFVIAPAFDDSCYTFLGMVSTQDPIFTNPRDPYYPDGKYHGQPIQVASWCGKASLVHEIGHDLGLWHEQKRCDRDQYLEIIWSNIKKDAWSQYETLCDPQQPSKSPASPDTGYGYDYCSIMHYKRFSGFAVDQSKPVFNIKQKVVGCDEKAIGNAEVYSPADIAAINSVYSFVQ
jgi:Astacin (Peptidase family M12A)